ncbi:DUF2953 domain-containing protein [Tissierella sp. MSJ-40]|uniref:DUF2953 domain-containing protein n=1 Tax=Tissierella simiarum TaxID=2841534 RepID=A0ABS6E3U5_9FIRM|nr:DUF2953 domain-containing protein [Tissierella simiarum]MBU5437579.1 DUF2953 domain-containing protein [Tissierella simiarum]
MDYFVIIITIIIILLIVLLLIPLKIKIDYTYLDGSNYKIIFSYLFGLVKKEIDSNNKENKCKDTNNGSKKVSSKEYIKYFLDKGKIEKLFLTLTIGISDPFLLGITTGVCWSLINIILSILFMNKDIDKVISREINVLPIFNENIFQIHLNCIIKLNLVYIITAYIRILKEKEGGENFARASN